MKKCFKCEQEKPFSEFYKCSRDGYQSSCKPCKRFLKKASDKTYYEKHKVLKPKKENVFKGKEQDYKKEWHVKNKERMNKSMTDRYYASEKGQRSLEKKRLLAEGKRECTCCKEVKLLEVFPKEPRSKVYGVTARCFECIRPATRELAKKYARTKGRAAERLRNATDPAFNMIKRVRRALARLLDTKYRGKSSSYLPYTSLELKSHIESKFKDGMTWENREMWHIDHVTPFKYKNLDGTYFWDQNALKDPSSSVFSKVWSLDNLQPLWASENCSKGSRKVG